MQNKLTLKTMIDLFFIQELYSGVVQACPDLMANYGNKIWEACSQHHSNVVFNECTATIIAIGISIGAGAVGWGGSGSAGSGSAGSGHVGTSSPDFDSVLADNLPPDLRTYDSIADFHDITTWGQGTK